MSTTASIGKSFAEEYVRPNWDDGTAWLNDLNERLRQECNSYNQVEGVEKQIDVFEMDDGSPALYLCPIGGSRILIHIDREKQQVELERSMTNRPAFLRIKFSRTRDSAPTFLKCLNIDGIVEKMFEMLLGYSIDNTS